MKRKLDPIFWFILVSVTVTALSELLKGDWLGLLMVVSAFVGGIGAGLYLAKWRPWGSSS